MDLFLPVEYILLAVCPNWHAPIKHHQHKKYKKAQEKSRKLLKETIVNILQMAEKLEIKSLSLEAISYGAFGFPKDVCT